MGIAFNSPADFFADLPFIGEGRSRVRADINTRVETKHRLCEEKRPETPRRVTRRLFRPRVLLSRSD